VTERARDAAKKTSGSARQRMHTSAYVSVCIRQHTSKREHATRRRKRAEARTLRVISTKVLAFLVQKYTNGQRERAKRRSKRAEALVSVCIRQHTSAYAYVSIH
jgi:hypothetical protein